MDSLKYTQFDSVAQVVKINTNGLGEQPHIFKIDTYEQYLKDEIENPDIIH